ncbi:MAG: glycosyltransferase [Actinomycetota bacterium]|nr:glycosyltransferase [Actinomycetota bacterium]
MTERPIAVAISTRDRPQALERCLRSLAAGRLVPAEVVVADQSDGPETRELLARPGGGVSVRYVRARPGGLAAAQNDAVRATTTALVAVLDDDCVADERWLESISNAFSDGDLAFVSGPVLPLGPEAPGLHAVATRTSREPLELDARTLPWDAGSGNNFALRKDWFERIGGGDERLGPGAPGKGGLDMDLFRRLLRAGARGRYEPEAIVLHERATTAGRLARRFPYGYGMGACCVLWLRQGDREGLRVLRRWLAMRSNRLARSLARGRWLAVREEVLVLAGTAGGLLFGLRARDAGTP